MARRSEEESDRAQDAEPESAEREESQESEGEPAGDQSGEAPSASEREEDISDTPAPSVGPKTTFHREDPETRLSRHEQSDTDAMGLDKRREVIGGTYGPTLARQATMYGIFLLVVGAIVAGFLIAANKLDQPPDKYADEAPWSQADASQLKPPPIDFPRYGHPGPGEQPEQTPGEQRGSSSSETPADSSESH